MELNKPYGESAEDLERTEYMGDEGKQRELWCIMETLDANAKKADECAALLDEVAELLRGGNNEAR